jgi:hypothetical protein
MRSATRELDRLTHTTKDKASHAREQITPVLTTAKEKAQEILDSDAAHELARRSHNVVLAARGAAPVAAKARRRWPKKLFLFGLISGVGAGAMYVLRSMKGATTDYGPAQDAYLPPTMTPPSETIDLTKEETSFATPTV